MTDPETPQNGDAGVILAQEAKQAAGAQRPSGRQRKPLTPAEKRRREQAKRARAERTRRQQQEDTYEWLEQANLFSLSRKIAAGYTLIVGAVALVLVVVGIATAVLGNKFDVDENTRIVVAGGLWILAFLGGVVALAIRPMREARRALRQREHDAREKARHASDLISDAEDLGELLKANRKQMEAYDELARLQAKEAFRNSQVAIGVGMAVLVIGACAALVVNAPTGKVTTAALTALAGMLSGYIGKTFLRVYENAQRQLTFFFQQPLVTSYILSAERIIKHNIRRQKDQEVSRVVERVLEMLVDLPRVWDDAGGRGRPRRLKAAPAPAPPEAAAS